MSRKVAVFFPQNLYPPRSGYHKRGLEMLAGLKELGCTVTLLSSNLSYPRWENRDSLQALKANWVQDVLVYQEGILERWLVRLLHNWYQWVGKRPPLRSMVYTPPGLRRWFSHVLDEIAPDILLMSHACWDTMVDHRRFGSMVRAIDMLDLVTLNMAMWSELDTRLPRPPLDADAVDESLLCTDFFEKMELDVDPAEFSIYDNYTYTIAISSQEADVVRRNASHTEVLWIPMTQEPVCIPNRYEGAALFPAGLNPFNVQGYLFFVRRVLPLLQAKWPDFVLQVTGPVCKQLSPTEGVSLDGYMPDLQSVYESAAFVVCPVFGGTGQSIKIVEAMAHGLPVVALRFAADRSPIRHAVNGFIADDAEEFAEYVIRLWNDRELCRQLGNAARETIASEFSRARLLEKLALVVESR